MMRGNSESDPRRDIGLDQACYNICGRPLGRNDQMHPGCSCLLCQTTDRFFHLRFGDHHQISQLVDYDDDLRHHQILIAPLLYYFIIACHFPHAFFCKSPVPVIHLCHRPVESSCSLGRLCHHRYQHMRDPVIVGKFHHFRVDQNQLDFIRRRFI